MKDVFKKISFFYFIYLIHGEYNQIILAKIVYLIYFVEQ